jgi:hypothetical protein
MCDYSDIFGRPGEGAHSIRVGGFAAVDLLLTAGAAVLIKKTVFSDKSSWLYLLIFIVLMICAIVLHKVFCVNTALNKIIFGEASKNKTMKTKYTSTINA